MNTELLKKISNIQEESERIINSLDFRDSINFIKRIKVGYSQKELQVCEEETDIEIFDVINSFEPKMERLLVLKEELISLLKSEGSEKKSHYYQHKIEKISGEVLDFQLQCMEEDNLIFDLIDSDFPFQDYFDEERYKLYQILYNKNNKKFKLFLIDTFNFADKVVKSKKKDEVQSMYYELELTDEYNNYLKIKTVK